MYTHQADDETSKLFKRRKMHVILCRVVLYIKRKNLFTVCDWCLLSACVSNLCVSCETLHCLAQALSGFCTWMWYRWNTQFVLFFIFHNQKYWIVLQMLQSGCCTWMWCMWNTQCVSKNQLCSSCLSIFEYHTLLFFSPASSAILDILYIQYIWISYFVVLQSSFWMRRASSRNFVSPILFRESSTTFAFHNDKWNSDDIRQ